MRDEFRNEVPMDFGIETNRIAMQRAVDDVATQFGQQYPLIINGTRITSRNPGTLDQTITAAEEAFQPWRMMSAEGRVSGAFMVARAVGERVSS